MIAWIKRLGPRRTAGNEHVHRQIPVNAFEHVVALLERPAGNGARAHGNDVFRLGHLVVKPHHLRRHFLGHRAGHNHQVRLPRRGPEHLRPKPRQVEPRHGRRNHFDGAAGQAKGQRPHRVRAPPVIQVLQGRQIDALFLSSLLRPSSIMANQIHFQVRTPFRQAQTRPSTSSRMKIKIATKAPTGRPVKDTANGSRKMVSTSKTRKMIAYR